ncbi:MAG: hypothetical protein WDW38_005152 [Sanguina aurantia]
MTRSNSQRAGVGMSSRDTQAAAQEPTISAWATNQNSWEENPRDCRDEIKLYMADKSIQTGGSSGSSGLAASGTSVTKLKTGSGGGSFTSTGPSQTTTPGSHQASAAAAVSSAAPSAVSNGSSMPHPTFAATAPLSGDMHQSQSESFVSSQPASDATASPAQLQQHQTSFARMPSLSESWPHVPTALRGSVVQLPASGSGASIGFATPQIGALPSTTPILRSLSSSHRRSRLGSSSMHRAPDSPGHEAMSGAPRQAEEAGLADRVLRAASGSGSGPGPGLGRSLSSGTSFPVGHPTSGSPAEASLQAQASYDSSDDIAGSEKSYVDLLDAEENDDGGAVCSPLTAAAPPQLMSPQRVGGGPGTGHSGVLVLSPAEPGWQQLPERGAGIDGQSSRAGAASMRGSSNRQHLTAHDTCPQGNESPPGSGTTRTSSSPPRLGTAQHRRRTVFHSVPISPDASLLSVSISTANANADSKSSKGHTHDGATLLGATTAPLPRPLLTNLATRPHPAMAELIQRYQHHPVMAAARVAAGGLPVRPHTQPNTCSYSSPWQASGGENQTPRQTRSQPQQQQLRFDPPTNPTTGIASVSGLMRLSFSRGRGATHLPAAAACRHSRHHHAVGAPELDELSAAHSRLPRSPDHGGAEDSGLHVSHVQHRWGGQLLARLGGSSTGGVQRPATTPTPGRHRDPYLTAKTSCSHYSLARMEQRPLSDLPASSSRWLATAATPPPVAPSVPVSITTIPSALVLARPTLKQSTSHSSVPAVPGTLSSTPTGDGHVRASLLVYPLSAPDFLQAIRTAPTYAQPGPNFPGAGSSARSARFQAPFAARKLRLPGCGPSGPKDSTLGLETMSTRNSHPQGCVQAEMGACGQGPAGSRTCRGLGGKNGKSRQPGGSDLSLRLSAAWQGTERDSAILVSSIASGS